MLETSSFLTLPEDGHYLDYKTSQHKDGSQGEVLEIKHFLVENVGVGRATAAHEDETQGDEGDADEHDDVVLLAERHSFLAFSVFGHFLLCVVVFCHDANFVQK